jgi:tetratricopeptide (TPR) repeat protein
MQPKPKQTLLFAAILLAVIVVVGAFFFLGGQKERVGGIDWNNPDEVFAIDIPEDFEAAKLERVNEKVAAARAAYDENKEDNWTWVMVGNLYEFVHDYDRAILAYKKSLELQPYDITSTLNLATIYSDYKPDFDQAELYYKKAIEIHVAEPSLYDMLAKFYIQKEKNDQKGEAAYLLGLERTRNHPDLLAALVKFYRDRGNTEKEEIYAKDLLESGAANETFLEEYSHLIE